MAVFTKLSTIAFLNKLDEDLAEQGYQRKFSLYCTGGTKMVLSGLRHSTKDVDFLLSRRDHVTLGSYVGEYLRNEDVRFDLFPDGKMPGYEYPDYRENAQRAPYKFRKIDLYYIDDLDFVITKALAFRDKDIMDLDVIMSIRKFTKDQVLERYQGVKFEPEKENELKQKFEEFLKGYFGSLENAN